MTSKPAKPARAKKPFDGARLIPLLRAPHDDKHLVAILRELGHTKDLLESSRTWPPSIELKKLGLALQFEGKRTGKPKLLQIQFELRRRWTGHSKYRGLLPYGLSPDLRTADRSTALVGHATKVTEGDDWSYYDFPTHQVAMGFGKTFVETVFVMADKSV